MGGGGSATKAVGSQRECTEDGVAVQVTEPERVLGTWIWNDGGCFGERWKTTGLVGQAGTKRRRLGRVGVSFALGGATAEVKRAREYECRLSD